ncbi:hypothetical protein [Amycolatopsis sp. NPDC051903]|uniref:hypothetical protein n=1 Tax=Amycolatopsis sp. NPDC051903 TaxID=3363936 RepID=UPI00379DCCD2
MTREFFPRDDHPDDEDDLAGLPDPQKLRSEVATAPGPDLTPSHTKDVDAPPGTEDAADPADG